jgi:uncharacterized protein
MPVLPEDNRLLLFARSPVLGRVKTRLESVHGAASALAIHQDLIRFCWRQLTQSGLGAVELWISEAGQEVFFGGFSAAEQRYLQQGEDLGERMHFAVCSALSRGSTVLISGADCPAVDAAYLESAIRCLDEGADVVLGPAEDGGYVLVGMREPHQAMFEGIAWGTDQVMVQTQQRLRDAGVRWQELELCWDVDRPEDLRRLHKLPGWSRVD